MAEFITVDESISYEVKKAVLERMRQISREGWTLEHDDQHKFGELAMAAVSYIIPPINREMQYRHGKLGTTTNVPEEWPIEWDASWFKPADDPDDIEQRMREMEKGIALALAEYGRLHRLSKRTQTSKSLSGE